MEIVGNSIIETDLAMELCKEVQVEEYVIHVVGSTNFYTHLPFSLLTWFPRLLGACLWSALHMLLVLFEALMLLVLFSTGFVLAVSWDAFLVFLCINMVLLLSFIFIATFIVGMVIVVALAWLWLGISCLCCILPRQDLGRFILSAGRTLWHDLQPLLLVEGGATAADRPPTFLQDYFMSIMTPRFVRHVILSSFPYWRTQLGHLCREIVPWYDTIVI